MPSSPQLLEALGVGSGIPDGVLDVAMPQIVLNEAGVCPLVGQGIAAGVP